MPVKIKSKKEKPRVSTRWINDNRIIAVISLVLSIALWVIVSVNVTAERSKTITDIPISIDTTDLNANFGLDKISIVDPPALSSGYLDVVVSGSIYQLARVSAEDISVTAQTGGVNRAGEYTLMLSVSCANKDVKVSVASNYTFIKVWFDRIMSKDLSVDKLSVSGVSAASDELIIGDYYSSIKSITVTGPESIIETLGSAQIKAELDKKLKETETVTGSIFYLDTNGKEQSAEIASHLSIIDYNGIEASTGTPAGAPPAEDITITVPIRKAIELPLRVSFKNAPEGFDSSTLKYTLSVKKITLEGDVGAIDKLADIGYYALDSVDLSTLSQQNSVYTIKLNLSSGVEEQNGVSEVKLSFDLRDYETKTITLRGSGVFRFTDIPDGVSASLLTEELNVTVIGPAAELERISASSLSVSISLDGLAGTIGQKKLAASVVLSKSTHCWVTGSYTVMASF